MYRHKLSADWSVRTALTALLLLLFSFEAHGSPFRRVRERVAGRVRHNRTRASRQTRTRRTVRTMSARRRIRPTSRGRTTRSRGRRCGLKDRTIPLKYVHGGQVWIPREAGCGGTYPVIVLLHGNNSFGRHFKYIGGGKAIDKIARSYLNGGFIEPVILAQPIHQAVCRHASRRDGVDLLWGGNFDFKVYRSLLLKVLHKNRIRPRSWSFIGHSGAGCCITSGLFAAAELWKDIKVWATADTCYGSSYASVPRKRFAKSSTIVYNACRGADAYSGYPVYARMMFTGQPLSTSCDSTYYKRCIRHPTHPWYSFVTKPKTVQGHGPVVTELAKTILWRHFPSRRRLTARARRNALWAQRRRKTGRSNQHLTDRGDH